MNVVRTDRPLLLLWISLLEKLATLERENSLLREEKARLEHQVDSLEQELDRIA